MNNKITAEQFAYWLNGFFELSEAKSLNENQVEIIKNHLNLVFDKVTPNIGVTSKEEIETYIKAKKSFNDIDSSKRYCYSNQNDGFLQIDPRITCALTC